MHNFKSRFNLLTPLIFSFLIFGLENCRNDNNVDYRDSFIGAYSCNVTEHLTSGAFGIDTIMYSTDTVYVTKGEEPDKLTLLGRTEVVNTNGEIETGYDSYGHNFLVKFTTNKIKIDFQSGGHGWTSDWNYEGTKR